MDWITEGLGLGSWYDCQDHAYLQEQGVESILQLYGPDPCPDGFPFARASLQLNVVDARPLPTLVLQAGVAFIREQRRQGRNVLVACAAGMSRSPSFLAAYLHEEGMDLAEAYLAIRARRSIIPHPKVIQSLVDHYRLPITTQEIMVRLVRERPR